jgi:hypothetical protein
MNEGSPNDFNQIIVVYFITLKLLSGAEMRHTCLELQDSTAHCADYP